MSVRITEVGRAVAPVGVVNTLHHRNPYGDYIVHVEVCVRGDTAATNVDVFLMASATLYGRPLMNTTEHIGSVTLASVPPGPCTQLRVKWEVDAAVGDVDLVATAWGREEDPTPETNVDRARVSFLLSGHGGILVA